MGLLDGFVLFWLGCNVIVNLNNDRSTVHKIIHLFHVISNVSKRSYLLNSNMACKLSKPAQLLNLNKLLKYLRYIYEKLEKWWEWFHGHRHGCFNHLQVLDKNCITIQKMHIIALQRDEFIRQKFINDASVYNPDMLVLLDESKANHHNIIRKYGYGIRGKSPSYYIVREKRVSGLTLISLMVYWMSR